ncbi:929_t:CDS:2 [Dentiscutata erythropus]|uniref:929_t:CDS:1 n=1 Tax=Dentiscutata erythropus TaxID=1348616 RepID=A0A9N9ARR0_9GLOM|nr:929_t:CDS:2 [Dentiscutata erythropus]
MSELASLFPKYQLIGYLDSRDGASTASDANNIYVFDSLPEDPIPNYVQDTNSTPSPRKWHTSVIDNKKLYVLGGVRSMTGGTNLSLGDGTIYIYDITQSIWTSNPTLNQPIGRQQHTATLLHDGRIIMIGGAFVPM